MTTALFPGSFNPFTLGHLSIVERASRIFDKIIIAVGVNIAKTSASEAAVRLEEIENAVCGIPNVSVITYNGLTTEICKKTGATVIIRGLRNSSDFNYEQQLAEVNRRISGIETLFINSTPELACISSSMVRELAHYGVDITEFIPKQTR